MRFAPNGDQAMVLDMVARFLAARTDPATMAAGPMPAKDWSALGELGLFGFLLPEAAGGMGGAPQDVMLVAEAFGRSLAITPLAEGVVICGHLLGVAASSPRGDQLLAGIAQGTLTLAFARGGTISDKGLTGHLGLVRDGMAAEAFLVAAEDGGVALLAADDPRLHRRPVRLVDGSLAADLRCDAAGAALLEVPERQVAAALALGQLAIVAEMVGAMATLLDMTVDYVKQRRQFGQAIASFQVIQHRCARLYVMLEQARSMMLRAALAPEGERQASVAAARAYAGEAALRLAEEAVQFHGGMGVTDELAVGRGLRRVLLLSRLFGGPCAARAELAA